jgi:hypothetical protein
LKKADCDVENTYFAALCARLNIPVRHCGACSKCRERIDAFKAALFDPVHLAELAKFDQEVAYLGSADYANSMREAFAAEGRAVERLGLAHA